MSDTKKRFVLIREEHLIRGVMLTAVSVIVGAASHPVTSGYASFAVAMTAVAGFLGFNLRKRLQRALVHPQSSVVPLESSAMTAFRQAVIALPLVGLLILAAATVSDPFPAYGLVAGFGVASLYVAWWVRLQERNLHARLARRASVRFRVADVVVRPPAQRIHDPLNHDA